MEWGIKFFDELERMKRRMDQTWSELFEKAQNEEERTGQEFERLPKFEGIGRGASRPKQNRK